MFNQLPKEIQNYIIDDYLNMVEYWKRRFSNDVLTYIDKHYKLCAMMCNVHRYLNTECDCADEYLYPCANCYSYGYCSTTSIDHMKCKHITFNEMKKSKIHTILIKNPYIPAETFLFISKNYEINDYKYSREFETIRNELPIQLLIARFKYLLNPLHNLICDNSTYEEFIAIDNLLSIRKQKSIFW